MYLVALQVGTWANYCSYHWKNCNLRHSGDKHGWLITYQARQSEPKKNYLNSKLL